MKLTKALKLKNRLIGEINQLRSVLQRENSRRDDNLSTVDCEIIYKEIIIKRDELISLKSAICEANAGARIKNNGIYHKIERMSELKSFINFINGLSKREGPEITLIGANREKLNYLWKAYINQQNADEKIKALQAEINNLQDDIDTFNAEVNIDI